MQITISTEVKQCPEKVYAKFDKNLFLALKPPLMPMRLLRFDNCEQGAIVTVKLFGMLTWESLVTYNHKSTQEIIFIDEGQQLPFFLSTWQHQHRLMRTKTEGTLITDSIDYQCPFPFLTYLLYPFFYLQFWYRRPIYKRYFTKV